MKYDENFHNKCYCLFTQFTFKLNSINTVKEGIQELCNRNMIKIFKINVIVSLHNLHLKLSQQIL